MMHALTHAGSIALLALLFSATGALIERVAPWGEIRTLGHGLVRMTVGIIAWIAGLFVLACTGGLRRAVVLPVACAIILAAAPGVLRSGRELLTRLRRRPAADAPSARQRAATGVLPLIVPAATVLAVFVVALAPQIGWDDDTYHLTLPKHDIAHGGFAPAPFSVYSHWPQSIELLYALAMLVHDYVTAKLVHVLFLALLLLAVHRLCRRRVTALAADLAIALVLGNQVLLNEAPVAYVDIAFAFFFVMAMAFAWEYLDGGGAATLVLSGLCCGVLAGSKPSGLIGLVVVAAVVVVARPGRLAACLVVPALVLSIPWAIKSWIETGDPLYPLLYRWLGGAEWSADLGRQFMTWQRAIGMGRTPIDYLLLPLRVILSGGPGYDHFDGRISALWIVLVPLAVAAAPRAQIVRRAMLAAGVYFLAWALTSQQMRLLIPILPLLALSAGTGIEVALGSWSHRARRIAGGALVAAAGLWLIAGPARPLLAEASRVGVVLLSGGPERLGTPVPPGYAFINAQTPAAAKVMLLNANGTFFLDRTCIADSFFEASQMNELLHEARSVPEMRRLMSRLGVTHVYVSTRDWGIPYPQTLWDFLGDRDSAELVFNCPGGDCAVFRVLSPAIKPAA